MITMSLHEQRRRKTLEETIENIMKRKDRAIARGVEGVRRTLEAAYEAKIEYLTLRVRRGEKVKERKPQTISEMAQKMKEYRKIYYRRMGLSEAEAEKKATWDVEKWKSRMVA
jgi:hypothetical protein